ncbi:HNH endonuclease family protein [Brachyspira pulli]|uniref:HNH endonuclease family protein n=1 Tax=Brachyspira pulli TaxID=310721 RepID=UPI003004E460
MKIELNEILVKDIVKNYKNDIENGVIGYNGRLNIRPAYQREFVYKDQQRDAVIDTVRKDFPLNVMYWVINERGNYEMLDGQQRTISICDYVDGKFSINYQYFHNLEKDEQEQILNYKLMIYICEGSNKEKLDWFKIINIAGEKLFDQELRNAIYTGEWLSDAKRYFSKNNCPAYELANNYMKGTPIRQDYLETAIKWISNNEIEKYMSENQHNTNANELWLYFQSVINWVNVIFPKYRKEMKGIDWGFLYNKFKNKKLDADKLERKITELMQDEDVTKKSGIYEYLLDGNEKHLNIRTFSDNMKRETYERQNGICLKCKNHFEISEMEADHIKPWHEGGKTISENCQMLCRNCNRIKSGK